MNVCIVQARMGSMRFPGKSMEILDGKPLIHWSLRNALRIPGIDRVFLATTRLPEDDDLAAYAEACGVETYRGHETNVFSRFVEIADLTRSENIIRMTADNPLTPLDLATETLSAHLRILPDYTSTILSGSFPTGTDIEVFTSSALNRLACEDLTDSELEHVTLGFKSRAEKFVLLSPFRADCPSSIELTVDTPKNLKNLRAIVEGAPQNWDQKLSDVLLRCSHIMSRDGLY